MIWKISTQNGIPDDGEDGVTDGKEYPYHSSHEELGTDTTDSNGKYDSVT